MFSSLRSRLPVLGRWPRLLAAGTCLLLALASALGTARKPAAAGGTAPVVVAARDLPAGTRLTAKDLVIAGWPARLRPSGARDRPGALVGQRLAGPVTAHEPVTSARLLGAGLSRGLPSGLVATPLPLDDPHAADLAHAGDRVTVLETPRLPDEVTAEPGRIAHAERVVERALVLAVLPGSDDAAAEVVLAVDETTAVRLTRDRSTQMFTLVLNPP